MISHFFVPLVPFVGGAHTFPIWDTHLRRLPPPLFNLTMLAPLSFFCRNHLLDFSLFCAGKRWKCGRAPSSPSSSSPSSSNNNGGLIFPLFCMWESVALTWKKKKETALFTGKKDFSLLPLFQFPPFSSWPAKDELERVIQLEQAPSTFLLFFLRALRFLKLR